MSGYIGNIPVPQATQTRQSFTATASQTTFNTAGYSPGYVDVFLNGVKLAPADYTATNGSDVVLAVGAASGDILETVAYEIFQVLDQDFSGDFTVDGSTFVVDSTNDRVGVGTASPSALLELDNGGTSTGDVMVFNLGGENREHSFENVIATGRDLRLNTARDYRIKYGADTAGFPTEGEMIFEHGTNGEAMRIDSSGNLLVNTTASQSGLAKAAVQFDSGSQYGLEIKDAGAGTVGTAISLYRGSSQFGMIGVTDSDNLIISSTATDHAGLKFNNTAMAAFVNNASSDGTMSIGTSVVRFKDLYLSGGVYLGGTGSVNKLDDYETGTWDPYWGGDVSDPSASYTNQNGWYVKIGKQVWCGGVIHTSSASGGSGNLLIRGLPFYSASDQLNEVSTAGVGYANGFGTYYPTAGYMGRNRTFFNVSSVDQSNGTALVQVSYLTNTSYVNFNITYTTD